MVEHTPIFVTGCQRSGLSMTSAIFHVHGVWTGEESAQKIQKMSFFNKRIWNDGFLPLFFHHQKFSEKGFDSKDSAVKHIESLLVHQGFRGGYWLLKSHQLIQHRKVIVELFPSAIWVLVRRDVESILKSCVKTFPLGLRKTEDEWRQLILDTVKKMDEIEKENNVFVVRPEKFFKGDFSEIKKIICSELKMEWMGSVVSELFKKVKKVKNGKSNNK